MTAGQLHRILNHVVWYASDQQLGTDIAAYNEPYASICRTIAGWSLRQFACSLLSITWKPWPLTLLVIHFVCFNPQSFFAGGQLVEQFEELGPLATILDKLKPGMRRVNDSMLSHPIANGQGQLDARIGIPASQSRRCIVELPFGLFKSGKC